MILPIVAAVFFIACLCTRDIHGITYSATSTVYSTAEGGSNLEQAQQITSAMQRYAEVAQSIKVLGRAAALMEENITGEQLSRMISVSYAKDSSILHLRAVSESPVEAISAANAVAAAFVAEITSITGRNNAQILDVATSYKIMQDSWRIKWLMRGLAAALAFLCSAAFILLADILSPKIHSVQSAGLGGELEILGIIPDVGRRKRGE